MDRRALGWPLSNGTVLITYNDDSDIHQSGIIRTNGTWVWPLVERTIILHPAIIGLGFVNQNDLLFVAENGKTGVFNLDGLAVLSGWYDQVFVAVRDKFLVRQGRYSGIVDVNGQWMFRKSLLDYLPD